ncbi:MAG: exonuclease sbcCD subunit D [Bacteroidetes bacterium 4572_128]|nr:MAG: exonuclease sbcCD subunit D [Bacteroidetes bacterium 4572_128]
MKILHTSDWHLGHKFHEQSQKEEELKFLNFLIEYINKNDIDILLVSGDIFDMSFPSAGARKIYYDFLKNFTKTNCKYLIIIGGNHDSPENINAPKELLDIFSIYVIGKATDNIEDEIFEFPIKDEKIIIAAVPYLRDRDIRKAISSESHDEIENRYKTALIKHYNKISEKCENLKKENTVTIAMGHLFAIGGSTSNSEQTIYVGNLGDIGEKDFPKTFDYIALGHLHKCQKVARKNHIRYSGSPNILSFSEVNQEKKMIEILTENGKIKDIKEINIPKFRNILRISGTVDECKFKILKMKNEKHKLTTWLEVILSSKNGDHYKINEFLEKQNIKNIKILKISLKNQKKNFFIEEKIENSEEIKDLKEEEVFKMKCKEQKFNIDKNPGILDIFNEILSTINKS